MVVLASKSTRDAIGIDTFERGFVYSALLLNKTLRDPANQPPSGTNPYLDAVQFSFESEGLRVTTRLPYDRLVAATTAFNLIQACKAFGPWDPGAFGATVPPTYPNPLVLPADPADVTTLEKYHLWTAQQLTSSLDNYGVVPQESQLIDGANPTLQVEGLVSYDRDLFQCVNNLLRTLSQELTFDPLLNVLSMSGTGTITIEADGSFT